MLRFSLASLLLIITLVGLSCAAIMNPNIYFAAGIQFGLLSALLGSLFVTIFFRGSQQRIAAGFALFVIGSQFYSWMFTDPLNVNYRAATAIAQMHGEQEWGYPYIQATPYPWYGNTTQPVSPSVAYYAPSLQQPVNISVAMTLDFSAIQSIVHSLQLLVLGLIGTVVAAVANHFHRKQAALAAQETTHAHA